MKILIINPILYTSETNSIPKVNSIKDTMIYTLCLGFLKLGHEPVLLSSADYRPLKDEEYPIQIVFLNCLLKKIFPPRCIPFSPSIVRYLWNNKNKFDLVISSEVFAISSLIAAIVAKKKTIIWHELGAHNKILKKIPSKIWYNIFGRTIFRNVIIVPRSNIAYKFICKYCKNVSESYIDHCVNLKQFEISNIKNKQFIVISQLITRKKINGIIAAFSAFLKKYDNEFKLYIFGRGNLENDLRNQVKELEIMDSVKFMGFKSHNDIVNVLSKSKALLVNTEKDNNMVSIIESIAAGTPVLTNEVPFNSAYIKGSKLGIVKNRWGEDELYEISQNNDFYLNNCLKYREVLSNTYCSSKFVELFKQIIQLNM